MKLKKIIAIGLVATMTLGMSTSVFAAPAYTNYEDYPYFDTYDTDFGAYDNAFHAKGQGWLESGVGINETYTNVIVPTTPNITLTYGDPGLFDFGFDPQRLVARTDAAKYTGKNEFTPSALKNGVYFLNPMGGDYEHNYYDNASVKYQAMNIGTEPVVFSVKATLAGGDNFAYLDEEPIIDVTASEVFGELWEGLGGTWTSSEVVEQAHGQDPLDALTFARDLVSQDPGYEWTGEGGVFSDLQWSVVEVFAAMPFTKDDVMQPGQAVLVACCTTAQDVGDLYEALATWSVYNEPSDEVGMYLGLDVADGDENHTDYGIPQEYAFEEVNSADYDAEASFTKIVEGNADNYEMIYDPGIKDYRLALKEDRTEPFATAAFWFRGVATENTSVPTDLKVPELEFTWKFSKNVPTVAPKLSNVKVDGEDLPPAVANTLDYNTYGEFANIDLLFDLGTYKKITGIKYASVADGSYQSYTNPVQYYSIEGNSVTITNAIFDQVNRKGTRYWRVYFDRNEEVYVQLTFTPPTV